MARRDPDGDEQDGEPDGGAIGGAATAHVDPVPTGDRP